jgi:hypothetical protein
VFHMRVYTTQLSGFTTQLSALLACYERMLSLSRRDKTTVAQQFIAGITRIRQVQSRRTAEGSWPMKRRRVFSRACGTDSEGAPPSQQ